MISCSQLGLKNNVWILGRQTSLCVRPTLDEQSQGNLKKTPPICMIQPWGNWRSEHSLLMWELTEDLVSSKSSFILYRFRHKSVHLPLEGSLAFTDFRVNPCQPKQHGLVVVTLLLVCLISEVDPHLPVSLQAGLYNGSGASCF